MGKPWFGPKRYGIGIGPASPAGWLVMVVFVGAVAGALPLVRGLGWPDWAIAAIPVAALVVLVALVILKGGRPPLKWRWGDPR